MTPAKAFPTAAFLATAAVVFFGLLASPANAQFHSNRSITGPGSGGSGGANHGDPDVLARTIVHLNGDYTTTLRDSDASVITLKTYSKDKRLLESRVVKLDGQNKATFFQVLDPQGKLLYVGELIYDAYGRFIEERLYNTDRVMVRRRVQEYKPSGDALRVKTYFANGVPADLRGEVTLEMMQGQVPSGQTEVEEAGGAPKEEKAGFLGKLWPFGKKDDKKAE